MVKKKKHISVKKRHIHKKLGFGAAILAIIFLAIFSSLSNQKKIEHKEICDAIEEGISKEYKFGDYSYTVEIVNVETPGKIELKVEGNTFFLNKGESIDVFELHIRAITIYWQEAANNKDTVKFCIQA